MDRSAFDGHDVSERATHVDADHAAGGHGAYSWRATQPSRDHGSLLTEHRHSWHLTAMNQPPSESTGYRRRAADPHSGHSPGTTARSTSGADVCSCPPSSVEQDDR